ncbi:tRNA isopentenyltransferase [Trametes maxima]|nr:tRNA isopentenyltransferase [Trametes maxima]
MSSKPVIVICGTTGVGKSKLGGSRHPYRGAKIINADSMQVYVGMDVITNKVPFEERCGVEHLLMDYKKPGEQLTGPEWIKDAMNAIEEVHNRDEVPIVVGGTSYWIQHLIFPERMASLEKPGEPTTKPPTRPPYSESFVKALAALPPEMLSLFNNLPQQAPNADDDPTMSHNLHDLLLAMDPLVAQRWHWRDGRKVLTSLRIIEENRRLASEVIKEQSRGIPKPRYRTLCFWLYAKPDALKPRLDERVDQMIEQGLLNEIRLLKAIASAATNEDKPPSLENATSSESDTHFDYTLGIYQAIGDYCYPSSYNCALTIFPGYKEFHQYLNSSSPGESVFREAVEQMKLGTRRYAKRQVAWLRNKLVPAVNAANAHTKAESGAPVVPMFLLDATELGDAWKTNVHDVADKLTTKFLEEDSLPDPLTLSSTALEMLTVREKPTDPLEVLTANQRRVCEICTTDSAQPFLVDGGLWDTHLRSRNHRYMTGKGKKERGRPPAEAHVASIELSTETS